MRVIALEPDRLDEAVDVLCDAFADYPIMRFIVGPARDYDRRLGALVAFFTAARVLKAHLILGVEGGDGRLTGVANVTTPGGRATPPELDRRREALWQALGDDARQRYEMLGRTWQTFAFDEPRRVRDACVTPMRGGGQPR